MILEVAQATNQRTSGWNGRLTKLHFLIRASPEKYLEVRRGIYGSHRHAAIGIMKKFDMEEGKELLQMAESAIETK